MALGNYCVHLVDNPEDAWDMKNNTNKQHPLFKKCLAVHIQSNINAEGHRDISFISTLKSNYGNVVRSLKQIYTNFMDSLGKLKYNNVKYTLNQHGTLCINKM